jgi:hypothetical protein
VTIEHDTDQAPLPARQRKIIHIDMDALYASVDRRLNAHTLLVRKLCGRRSTSRLPALVDCVMTRPIVPAGMIADEFKITRRAAQDLVSELGLPETMERGRNPLT